MGSKTTANQFVGKGRGVSLALIIVLFLLASASLGRRTLVVKADSARAANPSRISNCKPKPGAAAYWQLTHSTSPTAPPAPRQVLRASFFLQSDGELGGGGSSQWCWGQACQHNLMVCDLGYADPTSGCCVRCCWNTSNCSESVCCSSLAD